MRIDAHNHAIPEEAIELLTSEPEFHVKLEGSRWNSGAHVDFTLSDSFVSPAAKIAELEANGLDGAVVSVAPPLLYYDVEPALAEALCSATNSGMSHFCEDFKDRLHWMAHVPMGVPDVAADMVEQATRGGAVGVEVGSSIAGRRLDEPIFEPFWAAAERARLPVMIHPAYNEPSAALNDFYMQNVIGNMLETTIAIERLICAGVLDRHRDLKILLVHAGGYFPYQAGRLKHARGVRPELSESPPDPWSYVGQISFDTIAHDRQALAYLVDRVGVENVLMGTDLPFDMAMREPMDAVVAAVGNSAATRIAETNPARLFRFEN